MTHQINILQRAAIKLGVYIYRRLMKLGMSTHFSKLAYAMINKKAVRLMAQLIKFYKFNYLLYLNKSWLNSQ